MQPQPQLACIWDMDGVLIDSSLAHFEAWQLFAAEMSREFTWAQHLDSLGRPTTEILGLYWGLSEPAHEITRLAERKEELFRLQARALQALPGATELVRQLHQQGWRQAVASGGSAANVNLLVDVLGIREYLQAVISANDIQRGKPDPQVFNKAMEALGVAPANSIVIEDATSGVQAAKAAHAYTIAVTNSRSRADLAAAGADLIVDTLVGLIPDHLAELLAKRRDAVGQS